MKYNSKSKIVLFPIEPFEERYTQQWYEWFSSALEELKIRHIVINPPQLNNGIKYGQVLDAVNTNYYKSLQIAEFMKLIHNKEIDDQTTVLLLDGWFPVEQLEYVRKITGIKFKIAGILHAGTWDPFDFLNRYSFKESKVDFFEISMLAILDKIYVASNFHKNLILEFVKKNNNFTLNSGFIDSIEKKIEIVRFPISIQDGRRSKQFNNRENNVIFPHRLDAEKRSDLFDVLKHANTQYSVLDYNFIKTKDVCNSKDEYYNLLSNSKVAVSFAQQETFGIAMLESAYFGCIPFVPDKLSFKEMYPSVFKYPINQSENFKYLLGRIKYLLDNYNIYSNIAKQLADQYSRAEYNILINLLNWSDNNV